MSLMNTNDERGFFRRSWDWISGDPEMVTRDYPLTQEGPGSVDSYGGTSPLMGAVSASWTGTNYPTWEEMVALMQEEVTPDAALTLGVVSRSIDIITTSCSQMEVGVYRGGIEIPIKYDNSNLVIRQPSPGVPIEELVQESVNSLGVYGNAFWYVEGSGKNVSAEIVPADAVTIGRDKNNKKQFTLPGFNKPVGVRAIDGNQPGVIHLKHTRRAGHDWGYGPIQQGKAEIKAALMLRDFQNKWFGNRTVPEMYLRTDQRMSAEDQMIMSEDFARLRREFPELPPVVSQGLELLSMRIKPNEAQMLEVMKANDINLGRIMGVPAYHLGVEIGGNSSTYTNLEGLQLQFLQTTLVRYMNEIERALGYLLPYGQRVQFKEEGLLRTDTKTKWEILEKQVNLGYTTGNELRAVEGKAPLIVTSMPKANPVTESEAENE